MAWLLLALLTLLFVASHAGLPPLMPSSEGDGNWIDAFVGFFLERRVWGRDVAFMYGPLSFLYSQQYDPALFAWVQAFNITCCLASVAALHQIASGRVWLTLAALGLWLLNQPPSRDAFFLMLPLLAILVYARDGASDRMGRWLWPLLMLLATLAGFAKFSVLLATAVLVVAGEAALLARRRHRWPLAALCFGGCLLLVPPLIGQPLAALPDFLATSFAISQGYGVDASLPGPDGWGTWERIGFLTAAAALLASHAWPVVRPRGRHRQPRGDLDRVLLAALPVSLFFTWKAGFVRHDAHALIAWTSLALLGSVVFAAKLRWPGQQWSAITALLLAIAAAGTAGVSYAAHNGWPLNQLQPMTRLRLLQQQTEALLDLAQDPTGVVAGLEAARRAAVQRIRTDDELPPLEGGVEVIPLPGNIVPAAGLTYTPRPTPGYAALSPGIMAMNLRHIEGPRGPRWILWDAWTLDNSVPGINDGNLLPALLRLYDPVDLVGGRMLLQRRSAPRPLDSHSYAPLALAPGQWIELPRAAGALWATIDTPLTGLGGVLALVWRTPILHLELEDDRGGRQVHRLPTINASGGFMLSPLLASPQALLALYPEHPYPLPAIRRLRLLAPDGADWAFALPAQLHLADLSIEGAAEHPASLALRSTTILLALSDSYVPDTSRYPPAMQGTAVLRAHAPSVLSVTRAELMQFVGLDGASELVLHYGIDDKASSGNNRTDGACFTLAEERHGSSTPLFQHCLDPLHAPADRGEHQAEIPLPGPLADRYVFRIEPGPTANWDWAYWSQVIFR